MLTKRYVRIHFICSFSMLIRILGNNSVKMLTKQTYESETVSLQAQVISFKISIYFMEN